ncbi:MAG: sel1 repeat family protein, partial [Candidatus Binataceae bacterium]
MRRTTASLLVAVLAAVASPLCADDRDARRAFDAGRFDEAFYLWLPLAAAGDGEAALNLGLLYDLGRGVPQDS